MQRVHRGKTAWLSEPQAPRPSASYVDRQATGQPISGLNSFGISHNVLQVARTAGSCMQRGATPASPILPPRHTHHRAASWLSAPRPDRPVFRLAAPLSRAVALGAGGRLGEHYGVDSGQPEGGAGAHAQLHKGQGWRGPKSDHLQPTAISSSVPGPNQWIHLNECVAGGMGRAGSSFKESSPCH